MTFNAYLWGECISNVDAILEYFGLIISKIPDQSFDSSVDLHIGQIFPVVSALHFLHANSFANIIYMKYRFLFLLFFGGFCVCIRGMH